MGKTLVVKKDCKLKTLKPGSTVKVTMFTNFRKYSGCHCRVNDRADATGVVIGNRQYSLRNFE